MRLPSSSWSGKGKVGLFSCLLDCDRGRFVGLHLLKLSSSSVHSAQEQLSPAPRLHGSRYISGGPLRGTGLYGRYTGASRRGLWFPLGDQAGFTGCDLRPLGRLYPRQMGTFVELPLPGHHTVVVTAPLYPCGAFGQPLQPDPGSSKELLLHVRHVLEGVIFFYAPPLLLEWALSYSIRIP